MKPKALRPGDSIGIVAPSSCAPALFPHRVEQGVRFLEELGFRVVIAPNTLGRHGWVSGTAEQRTDDIHRLFADPSVRAIFAAIGGDHSCHLLRLLDYHLIKQNPKIFMGFSDIAVLNLAIYQQTGLITFNGPTLMTEWAEFPRPFSYTVEHVMRTLTKPEAIGQIHPSSEWTEEFLDWGRQLDLTRPRKRQKASGWTWVRGGRASGRLIGGTMESLQHLRGTRYWPEMDGALLFLETSEVVPEPAWVDAVLQDYENMDILDQITGLLVGRPYGYTAEQREKLRDVVRHRTERYGFPVIMEMDFGHTSPQFALPIGCMAKIDGDARTFAITEAAVLP